MKRALLVAMLVAIPVLSFAQPPAAGGGGGQPPAGGGGRAGGGGGGGGGGGRGGAPAAPLIAAGSLPTAVTIIPSGQIGNGSAIPAGKALFFSAGYGGSGGGDTAGTRALTALQTQLARVGLTMKDVIQVNAYIKTSPDGTLDNRGWGMAWAKFFGTPENPTVPSRMTLGISSFVGSSTLELNAVAVYP